MTPTEAREFMKESFGPARARTVITKLAEQVEALTKERDALKSSNDSYITLANTAYAITEQRTLERDEYQQAADTQAAAYKVERDEWAKTDARLRDEVGNLQIGLYHWRDQWSITNKLLRGEK